MNDILTKSIAAALAIAALCLSAPSSAQPLVSKTRNPKFDEAVPIERFAAIRTDASTVATKPQLENGEVVNKRDFPAILSKEPDFSCTAALVGPATMLTAAHCINSTRDIELFFGINGVKAKCVVAPEYATDVTVDLSLCVLEYDVTGINYETVDQSVPPAAATEVTLVGYGCQVMGGNRDGNLRIGTSTVVDFPKTKIFSIPASWSAYIFTKSDISVPGNATLCPGDSGGPMYRGTLRDQRKIIGVNSRTTYGEGGDGVSLFSSVGTKEAKSFFNAFINTYGASICGVNRIAGCQQG